jgi:hypothetical protein
MQVWPPLAKVPHMMFRAAVRGSADPSTMVGLLPPSSSVTDDRWRAAAAITTLPTAGLPVKKTWSKGSSWRAMATSAAPSNTATSDSSKVSSTISRIRVDIAGDCSDGLMTAVLPAAMAETSGPNARLNG